MMVLKKFYRIIILLVLGFEAPGCLAGGVLLMVKPDLMKMPIEIMHGAFSSFRIPGVILFLLGILTSAAFSEWHTNRPGSVLHYS